MSKNRDEQFMERCLVLAEKALGGAQPNPLVGAVLVVDDKIIAEGYHSEFGGPHAEPEVIKLVKDPALLRRATLYVNLEPCSHHGKTGPCTDLIIQSGIPKIVAAMKDPNPLVAGSGFAKLRAAGVEVSVGTLAGKAAFVNRRFLTAQVLKRPYVILKWAESRDGFIAPDPPARLWLSGREARRIVHLWRTQESAVLVGTNTALIDDPALTARDVSGRNPTRIVIDRVLKLPRTLKIFNGESRTIVINEQLDREEGVVLLRKVNWGSDFLDQILKVILSTGLDSVIIEGGPKTLKLFLERNLWEEARIIVTGKKIGAGIPAPLLDRSRAELLPLGADTLYVVRNSSGA